MSEMILSCGEALVDLVPGPLPGGAPMNVAIAVARLGAPAAFVGGVSTDDFGDMLWSYMLANGVDLSLSRRLDAPTARAIVEHDTELRFRFEGDSTADTLLADLDLSRARGQGNIIHAGGLGIFRGQTAETLACLAEVHDGLVSFDPNIRPQIIDDRARWWSFHDRWLAQVDIYKASDEDLRWIWPHRSPERSAVALLDAGVSVVVLTRGVHGLTVFTSLTEVSVPSPEVEVVDTIGAGDSVVAVVLASVVEHLDGDVADLGLIGTEEWEVIAHRAVAAAAVTCGRLGADPPTHGELRW